MEIYLDANATTPVLPQAREAALAVMSDCFGNPSSIHSSGLKARALLVQARDGARRVLDAPTGSLLFTSGATESIQTAVLSALTALRQRRDAGETGARTLLHGATEHKAVPEALKHWNAVLGLGLEVRAIPVGIDGRHDLPWLRRQALSAGLVCTMAVNNETGVVSDLSGVAQALRDSKALWLVDGVQALGKVPLELCERRIDYAAFSGHKMYAPKGIGMLYVREGAPFTALLAGGGQEGAMRAGTENMAGIAALGAVLAALEDGETFRDLATLVGHRNRLAAALQEAFPGLVFNAPAEVCVPTTLNFAVPGLSSKVLLDLFDAAGLRVSGGSACSAGNAQPSYVLEAMGLPAWQAAAAVRLSFGAADSTPLIEEACSRVRACGRALRASCMSPSPPAQVPPADLVTRHVVDGACCYVVADASSRRCVVIDPLPALAERIAQWTQCRGFTLVAALDTHHRGDHGASAAQWRALLPQAAADGPPAELDEFGWPKGAHEIRLGACRLTRLDIPGETTASAAYLLHDAGGLKFAFVGDTVLPGAHGPGDVEQGVPMALQALERAVGPDTLLLPGHDDEDRFATTLRIEYAAQPPSGALPADTEAGRPPASLELRLEPLLELAASAARALVVDVREPYEQALSDVRGLGADCAQQATPLSSIVNAFSDWLRLPAGTPVLFYCRSGNRSMRAARALRRLGHGAAWSLEGGLALLPDHEPAVALPANPAARA